MKLEIFFEKFDQFADAPDAVAKMRELVLESAIRKGKLVSYSDAADETPVSSLIGALAHGADDRAKNGSRTRRLGHRGRGERNPFKRRFHLVGHWDDAYLQISPGGRTRLDKTRTVTLGATIRQSEVDSVSESGRQAELAKVEDGLPFIAKPRHRVSPAMRRTMHWFYDNGLKVPRGDPRFKVARGESRLDLCRRWKRWAEPIGIADRDICFGNKLYANSEVQEGNSSPIHLLRLSSADSLRSSE